MFHRTRATTAASSSRKHPAQEDEEDVEQSTVFSRRVSTQPKQGTVQPTPNGEATGPSSLPSSQSHGRPRRKRSKETRAPASISVSFASMMRSPSRLVATTLVCSVVLLLLLIMMWTRPATTKPAISRGHGVLLAMSALPMLSAASVLVSSQKQQQRLIAAFFVGAIVAGQLPKWISAAVVALALAVFGLATRPMPTPPIASSKSATTTTLAATAMSFQQHPGVRAALAAILTTISLLVENFFVWVVSATYLPSHAASPTPLQDNGRLLLQHYVVYGILGMDGDARKTMSTWRAQMNVQWALVAGLAGALVVCELQWMGTTTKSTATRSSSPSSSSSSSTTILLPRNMFGLVTRALMTLAFVRCIRTVSFLLTVLPSQVPQCYRQRFPLPPDTWREWILVGLLPQTHGGCNDLIVSGHATVTTVLACVSTSFSGNVWFAIGVWTLLALDFCVEVYEGYHYSVDMWMGALLTSLIWQVMAPIEQSFPDVAKRNLSPLSSTTPLLALQYAIPPVGAYLAITVLPKWTGNYWILLYVLVPAIQIVRDGFTHYVQHELFCTLYIALATYL